MATRRAMTRRDLLHAAGAVGAGLLLPSTTRAFPDDAATVTRPAGSAKLTIEFQGMCLLVPRGTALEALLVSSTAMEATHQPWLSIPSDIVKPGQKADAVIGLPGGRSLSCWRLDDQRVELGFHPSGKVNSINHGSHGAQPSTGQEEDAYWAPELSKITGGDLDEAKAQVCADTAAVIHIPSGGDLTTTRPSTKCVWKFEDHGSALRSQEIADRVVYQVYGDAKPMISIGSTMIALELGSISQERLVISNLPTAIMESDGMPHFMGFYKLLKGGKRPTLEVADTSCLKSRHTRANPCGIAQI
jgi:hypothetical protein